MDDAMKDELANEMEAPAEGASSVLGETLFDVGSGAVGASACTRDHVHQSGAEEDAIAWDVRAMAECDEEKEGAGEGGVRRGRRRRRPDSRTARSSAGRRQCRRAGAWATTSALLRYC